MLLYQIRLLCDSMDSKLTMESHTANVVRSCFYQLRQLQSIRCSLTVDARRTLATAFVANWVNYCNAMLYGTYTAVTRRLQTVLNAAARMVVGIGKYEHITPELDTLHWLPVTARIQFKIAALTFDCVRCTGPVYLKQVICPVSDLSCRSLRSAGRGDMFVSRANTSIGQRSFSISAPVVWTHFHLTSVHRTIVADISDLSWKPIFSDKPTLHDSSENTAVEECNSVTVTVSDTIRYDIGFAHENWHKLPV